MNTNANRLTAHMDLINDKVKFDCHVAGKEHIVVDYIPPVGDGEGYTSLELLLISAGTCLGTAVKSVVSNRLKINVESLSVAAEGLRRETHPTSYSEIELLLKINAPGLLGQQLQQVIDNAEEKICPVLHMIKGNTRLRTRFVLNESEVLV